MWIALRRHDGNVDSAARLLAELWRLDPSHARADLDIWVGERTGNRVCQSAVSSVPHHWANSWSCRTRVGWRTSG
jgi:hypothetical protein